jgi:hypothetical protein
MKNKTKTSSKKLKDLPGLEFIKRETQDLPDGLTGKRDSIRDYFLHRLSQFTFIRVMNRYWNLDGTISSYVWWSCEELGGGHANMGYWMRLATETYYRRKIYGKY